MRRQCRKTPYYYYFYLTFLHYNRFSSAHPQVSAIFYCKISTRTFLTNSRFSLHYPTSLTRLTLLVLRTRVPTSFDLVSLLCYIKKKNLQVGLQA